MVNYRYLGNSGFKVSEITYGNWVTHASQVGDDAAIATVHKALDLGITTFDTADAYANTAAEVVLAKALKGQERANLEIFTKVYWPIGKKGPNDTGLSRKHIMDGIHGSLRRLREKPEDGVEPLRRLRGVATHHDHIDISGLECREKLLQRHLRFRVGIFETRQQPHARRVRFALASDGDAAARPAVVKVAHCEFIGRREVFERRVAVVFMGRAPGLGCHGLRERGECDQTCKNMSHFFFFAFVACFINGSVTGSFTRAAGISVTSFRMDRVRAASATGCLPRTWSRSGSPVRPSRLLGPTSSTPFPSAACS